MRALAALAIIVAGAVGSFAVYTFGWRDDETAQPNAQGPRVYTIRMGDAVRVPAISAECVVDAEGAFPRLFCTRTRRGRYNVEIFGHSVHLYDLESPNAEPMVPTYSVPAVRTRP